MAKGEREKQMNEQAIKAHHHNLVTTSVDDAKTNIRNCQDLAKLKGALAYELENMNRVTLVTMLERRIRKVEASA